MKKLLALLLAILMMTAITACGGSDVQDTLDDVSDVVSDLLNGDYDSSKVESTMNALNSAAQDANAKLNITVAEYAAELKESADFKQLVESYKEQYINADVMAEGNNLVYTYTYTVEVDVAYAKQVIEAADNSAMEASVQVLQTVLTKLDKVIVRYYTKDGALITSAEF